MDGGLDATEALIKQTFGRIPPGRHPLPAGPATAAALENSAAVLAAGAAAVATNGGGGPSPMVGPLKERHPLRPPVAHRFGRGKPDGWQMAPVSVFRHRLLQHFMLSVFCKLPIKPIQYVFLGVLWMLHIIVVVVDGFHTINLVHNPL